ncbi:thermostable hemolysin [Sphingomonas sp. CJ20]
MVQTASELIVDRYAAVHGARVAPDFPNYCTVNDDSGPCAVLGFRSAGAGALFLERYLDDAIEVAVREALDIAVPRDRIVEIGAHASSRPYATIALWARAAATLDGQSDVAVAVLTAPLRAMFARLGLPIVEIAPAARDRMGPQGAAWGRYYEADPVVCAGWIAAARTPLARWQERRAA